jgi:hypothetical protein
MSFMSAAAGPSSMRSKNTVEPQTEPENSPNASLSPGVIPESGAEAERYRQRGRGMAEHIGESLGKCETWRTCNSDRPLSSYERRGDGQWRKRINEEGWTTRGVAHP